MSAPMRISPASEVFLDARGAERALKVTWHHEVGILVLSLWRGDRCVGTLQLAADEVPGAIAALSQGLAEGYAERGSGAAPEAAAG